MEKFIADNPVADVELLPAAGSAGIEAAVNQVVRKAWIEMLFYVYGVVAVLCLIAFRSWRAVIVALLPLALTSILCEALMVMLGIGVKVATLPVIALGVGIGVDYALYLLSVQLQRSAPGPVADRTPTAPRWPSPAASSRWSASRWRPASSPGPGHRSSSRPTWESCWRSCSCGTCSAR